MKKWIAGLMALLLLVGMLVGCGAKEKDSDEKQTEATQATQTEATPTPTQAPTQAPTQPSGTEAAVGTLMNVPEKTFDESTTQLYMLMVIPDESGKEVQMGITVKDLPDGSSILYVTDGMIPTAEIVYEIAANETVTKYTRGMLQDNFTKDTAAAQAALQAEVEDVIEAFAMTLAFDSAMEGVQLRKADNNTMTVVSPAYGYDVLEDGVKTGYVCIHKETGIAVDLRDENGNKIFWLMDIKVGNVEIPQYK